MLWCHGAMVSWCLEVMVPWCHNGMMSWSQGVRVSGCHGVIVSSCHLVMVWQWLSVTVSRCDSVNRWGGTQCAPTSGTSRTGNSRWPAGLRDMMFVWNPLNCCDHCFQNLMLQYLFLRPLVVITVEESLVTIPVSRSHHIGRRAYCKAELLCFTRLFCKTSNWLRQLNYVLISEWTFLSPTSVCP